MDAHATNQESHLHLLNVNDLLEIIEFILDMRLNNMFNFMHVFGVYKLNSI